MLLERVVSSVVNSIRAGSPAPPSDLIQRQAGQCGITKNRGICLLSTQQGDLIHYLAVSAPMATQASCAPWLLVAVGVACRLSQEHIDPLKLNLNEFLLQRHRAVVLAVVFALYMLVW